MLAGLGSASDLTAGHALPPQPLQYAIPSGRQPAGDHPHQPPHAFRRSLTTPYQCPEVPWWHICSKGRAEAGGCVPQPKFMQNGDVKIPSGVVLPQVPMAGPALGAGAAAAAPQGGLLRRPTASARRRRSLRPPRRTPMASPRCAALVPKQPTLWQAQAATLRHALVAAPHPPGLPGARAPRMGGAAGHASQWILLAARRRRSHAGACTDCRMASVSLTRMARSLQHTPHSCRALRGCPRRAASQLAQVRSGNGIWF